MGMRFGQSTAGDAAAAEQSLLVEGLRPQRSLLFRFWRAWRHKPLAAAGGLVVLFVVVVALLAPWISPYHPLYPNLGDELKGISTTYWMGTDNFGRDILSRVIHGARVSLIVAAVSVGVGVTGATALGMVTGYVGGRLDRYAQRFVDAFMSIPALVFLLVAAGALGPSLQTVIVILAVRYTFTQSRLIRGSVISIKENQYFDGAKAIGVPLIGILWRYVLPNVGPTALVLATAAVGWAILAEASLSFLGYGVPPPSPTWGGMLAFESRDFFRQQWTMAVAPGVILTIVVFSMNMFGDGVRDVLDPRLRGSRTEAQ